MGAAGAVGSAAGMALAGDLGRLATVEEEVDDPLAVAAGDDHGMRSQGEHLAGEVLLRVALLIAAQRPRLGDVGGDHGGKRQQALDQRRPGFLVEQHGAALGDHHRIDHYRRLADEAKRLDHCLDGLSGPQHPDLDRGDANVFGDRPNLGEDHLGRDGFNRLDSDGVLRRDRRDRSHPVHATAREGLEVGLDAGAAAGVRAGDREDGGNHAGQISSSIRSGHRGTVSRVRE